MAAVAVIAAPCAVNAAVLDFEGIAEGTVLSTEYADVTISGATVLTAPNYNSTGFPPNSGVNVVYSASSGLIEFIFATRMSDVGAFFTSAAPLTLSAFQGSKLLGTTVFSGNNANGNGQANLFMSYAGGSITRVTFTGDANGFTLDDFHYDQRGGIPEPATWAMMIMGLGAAGGALRYRQRRVSVTYA
jgi:hypothetical protein